MKVPMVEIDLKENYFGMS